MELNLSSMRKKTYRQLETLSSSSPSQFSSHEPATDNCRSVFLHRKWMGFLHLNSALLCVKKNVEWLPQHFSYMEKHVSEVNKAAPVIVSVCLCKSCMFVYACTCKTEWSVSGGALIHQSGSAVSFLSGHRGSARGEQRDIRMFEHWKNKHMHKHAERDTHFLPRIMSLVSLHTLTSHIIKLII